MGRRHAADVQEEGIVAVVVVVGFGRDEELLVIRFSELVLNCKRTGGGAERELNPSFGSCALNTARHHVVLALPRAVLDDRAHVSCCG